MVEPQVEKGSIHFNFSNFDRWVETFEKAGAMDWIEERHILDRAGGYDEPLPLPAFTLGQFPVHLDWISALGLELVVSRPHEGYPAGHQPE